MKLSIKANSKFEAFVVLVHKYINEFEISHSHYNTYDILKYYYKIDMKYIQAVNRLAPVNYIISEWGQFIEIWINQIHPLLFAGFPKTKDALWKELNLNILPFKTRLGTKDLKFLKFVYDNKLVHTIINSDEFTEIFTSINVIRILKKIKNNNYNHIYRLFTCSNLC